ncbi:ubiquitin-specific protease 10 [Arabidopsis thaliana]|uniref:Ubiquitin carboxyl-terminal hydrolase 9 n=2 Tax=Arabidopsis thaliana TaxID=3702 RepID=UBP9_ARATH|nr:ubiquitin-specific protease 10 [Arabidopsis thaliana]NP_001328409.1 ubiquitin-specific protease 10 [Arabidopsis thaliana]NP_567363.1 ubiquitin-specific protease 10 [Arabidopsis thaliana]NP_849356.1 ubiquitin-specific protease 10 [Arabidopsis thaliana]Q93Y01.1 RecName: Full=Ubiquitin carboxyl-terminal hydrolase 9; AltName: Full=Deubiquitinating enzyme 9; Short=AtUBP9; AltName: Full=Ubiquitin thioesterase 9; AltName: Full=Ubiquitin-specific-processing protease 9 [Arabidopsis thaliana]AAK96655|eukprot:NP_001328408.1 ubiquitin-specific protease 10 [Arabidopsis thaliana]
MTIPNSDFMIENGVCDFPTTPEEEKRIVSELITESEDNLKEGNLYFVISKRWYTSWEKYVEQSTKEYISGESSEASRPGPIDNHDIIESESDVNDPQLRRLLMERVDYVLVPQEVWKRLVEWYSGGPPIERKLICQGFYTRSYSVEVYPLCLMLTDGRDESRTVIRLGKQASIRELYEKVCALTGVPQEKAHIWDYFDKRKNGLLDSLSYKSLEESSLHMDQDILLEVDGSSSSQSAMSSTGNELALVPLEPSRSSVTIAGGPTLSNGHSTTSNFSLFPRITSEDDGSNSLSILGKGEKGGLAGLSNLGNTCFMNSALQCLAHTPPIVEYFLQDYSDDINRDNPLGMCGELAIAFGDLLKKLWSSGRNSVAPRAFKTKLARFAPQFSGYNQHDSQELLAFLLDGLHEDLNKVKRKPYIELKDSDSRPDDEVAEELWNYHKARNDSVIVDVCQGQYKSTLVCPACGKISITFDPFMYLSVPLPSTLTRSMTVTVFYCDGSHLPMPYTVIVPKNGSIRDLITALGTACLLAEDESLLLAEVYDHKIFKYFENPLDSLSSIKDDEHIVAYRLNQMPKGSGKAKLEILHGGQKRPILESVRGRDVKLFGTPFVTYVNTEPLSGADIDAVLSRFLSPLHKVHAPSKIHNGSENGHLPDATVDEASEILSSPDTEIDDASDRELSFRIFLTDERGLNFKPLQSESSISLGIATRVLVEWNEGEHERYDSSYLSDLPEVHKTSFSAKKTRQESISLFSCLEAFLAEEPLGPDDMWFCPSCKEHRQANKKLDLWKLPDILVFHLKRFTYSRYLKNKIDTFVNFPVHDLDLSKYVKNKNDQSYLYELYAVSNHYGGLGGGHYTAYAKLIDDNEWYHFDDSHVSSVNESEIKNSAAYVLFYRRVRSETETQTVEMSTDMD